MSEAPPPPAYAPHERKTYGCARAMLILVFGVLLVAVLTWVTKDKETVVESSATATSPEEVPVRPLVDVTAIAGKNAEEVEGLLGAPAAKQDTPQGPKHVYQGGLVEIVFIDGKADWITVNPQSPVSFSEESLIRFGISGAEPSFSNGSVIRWEPCGDYASVSIFPSAGRVDYAYIKVATK